MHSNSTTRLSQALKASLLAVSAFSLASVASAQIPVYTETFQNPTVYTYGNSLSDQGGFLSNDEDTGATYSGNSIGQTDEVGNLTGFSTTQADDSAVFGGAFLPNPAPGRTNVTINHALPLGTATTAVFSSDFMVTRSLTPRGNHDNFGFSFLSTASTTPLFSVNFTLPNNGSATADNIGYSSNAAATATPNSLVLGLRYKLTVNVNLASHQFTASFATEDSTTGLVTSAQTVLGTNVPYTGTLGAYGVSWTLFDKTTTTAADAGAVPGGNNTAYTGAGSNALYFDNILVTVPEPSTYAMLALGALGLGVAVRRIRMA